MAGFNSKVVWMRSLSSVSSIYTEYICGVQLVLLVFGFPDVYLKSLTPPGARYRTTPRELILLAFFVLLSGLGFWTSSAGYLFIPSN